MCVPLAAAVVVAGAAAAGASVYSASKAAKATQNAANQAAQQNEQALNQQQALAQEQLKAQQQASDALLAETKAQGEAALQQARAASQAALEAMNKQAADFQSAQTALMDAQAKAAAEAAKRADDLIKNSGQRARAPNYSSRLSANQRANRGGISSTMLTGPSGVSTGSLNLGGSALLGA